MRRGQAFPDEALHFPHGRLGLLNSFLDVSRGYGEGDVAVDLPFLTLVSLTLVLRRFCSRRRCLGPRWCLPEAGLERSLETRQSIHKQRQGLRSLTHMPLPRAEPPRFRRYHLLRTHHALRQHLQTLR